MWLKKLWNKLVQIFRSPIVHDSAIQSSLVYRWLRNVTPKMWIKLKPFWNKLAEMWRKKEWSTSNSSIVPSLKKITNSGSNSHQSSPFHFYFYYYYYYFHWLIKTHPPEISTAQLQYQLKNDKRKILLFCTYNKFSTTKKNVAQIV